MKWTKNESGNIRLAFWYTHKYHWMHMISIFFHNVSLSPVLNDDTRCSEQTNGTCLIRMNNICIDSLELLVAIFSPGSIRWAHTHTLLLLYFICYSILLTCWAFSVEISTHTHTHRWGDLLTVRRSAQKQTDIKHTRVSIFLSCKMALSLSLSRSLILVYSPFCR